MGVGLLCLALIWLIVARGYADYLSGVSPKRAVALNPGHPAAVSQLAGDALDSGDLAKAQELAEGVAKLYPFEGRALRVLGAVQERQGQQGRAEQLMLAAARASPRDTATQYWLALNALSAQDLDQALQRLDRVLRFQPEAIRELFPLLGTIGANSFGARKLIPYLRRKPAWRSLFMERFMREVEPISAGLEIERMLAAVSSPIQSEVSGVITQRLLQAQHWEQLSARIEARSAVAAGHIRDPSFSGKPGEALLGWTWRKLAGADVVFGALDEMGTPALSVYFHNRRVPFKSFRQLLVMPPGSYRIDGRARLDQLETPRGLVWKLVCVGSKEADPVASSEFFRGNSPWREFSVSVEIPSQGCPAQWISLELAARIGAEQQINGAAWFTDFKLIPVEHAPTAAAGEPD